MAPNTPADTTTGIPRSGLPAAIERLEYGLPRPAEEAAYRPVAGAAALPAYQSVASGNFSAFSAAPSATPELAEPISSAEANWAQVAAELESRLAQENAKASQAIVTAREAGRREGQHAAEAAWSADQQKNMARVAATVEAFRAERQKYFKNVELEVVRLALAIAARVLHREAQLDPLFLAGAVRVALDRLADSSGVVLRVAPGQVLVWQEMFRLSGDAGAQPEILGDISLPSGECVLETRLGTIEVGVRAQLEEIEKGFFDLLDQRPSPMAGLAKRAV